MSDEKENKPVVDQIEEEEVIKSLPIIFSPSLYNLKIREQQQH